MANEKDWFGETLKLLDRAKEDIYFAERDRELIYKLRAQGASKSWPGNSGKAKHPDAKEAYINLT